MLELRSQKFSLANFRLNRNSRQQSSFPLFPMHSPAGFPRNTVFWIGDGKTNYMISHSDPGSLEIA